MAESESKIPFTEAGDCLDEVEFVFDDGLKLYVSQNFLYYVSPVFKAMFEHDFKEKETRIVTLKEKVYGDFLQFLLCLHPDVQKAVDNQNVLSVVHLAEEYQAKLILRKCKSIMSKWLQTELESARNSSEVLNKVERVRTCLRILSKAEFLQYNEIVEEACKVIGNFEQSIFTGTLSEEQVYESGLVMLEDGFCIEMFDKPANEDPLADCKALFENLPEHLKDKLMAARLQLCDNLEMHKP